MFYSTIWWLSHLEELHSYAGEHEVQEHGDQDDITDGLYGHKHTLDHVLEGEIRVHLVPIMYHACKIA